MRIRSLTIPTAMEQAMADGSLRRSSGSWQLNRPADAFGNLLEAELGEFYETAAAIEQATTRLPDDFAADGDYGGRGPEPSRPNSLADIVDFTKLLCFGMSGDGAPFCLDYRTTPDRPQVIWWDDDVWRVIAPDFESFLTLLANHAAAQQGDEADEA